MKRRRKEFNWAPHESLCQIEREEAFRLLKRAVESLPSPWDSRWKGVGRRPHDARILTVVTLWQEMEGKPERAYTADLERDWENLSISTLIFCRLLESGSIYPFKGLRASLAVPPVGWELRVSGSQRYLGKHRWL